MSEPIRKGRLFETLEDLESNGQVGDWALTIGRFTNQHGDSVDYLWVICPGDKEPRPLRLMTPELRGLNFRAVWEWNGSHEAPTLTPSILCGDTGWHGYMRAGQLVSV